MECAEILFSARSMPILACISGPRSTAAMISASIAALPLWMVLLGLRQPGYVIGGVFERKELTTAGTGKTSVAAAPTSRLSMFLNCGCGQNLD